jgi:hypothetical protein
MLSHRRAETVSTRSAQAPCSKCRVAASRRSFRMDVADGCSSCRADAAFCSFRTDAARDFAFDLRIQESLLVSQGYVTPNGKIPLILHGWRTVLLETHGRGGNRLQQPCKTSFRRLVSRSGCNNPAFRAWRGALANSSYPKRFEARYGLPIKFSSISGTIFRIPAHFCPKRSSRCSIFRTAEALDRLHRPEKSEQQIENLIGMPFEGPYRFNATTSRNESMGPDPFDSAKASRMTTGARDVVTPSCDNITRPRRHKKPRGILPRGFRATKCYDHARWCRRSAPW